MRELAARGPMPWRRLAFAAAAVLLIGYYIWAVYDRLDQRPVAFHPPSNEQQDDFDTTFPVPRPPRPLSDAEKVALLSNSLEDSTADESDLHVAEVAAIVPSDSENSDVAHIDAGVNSGNANSEHPADANGVGEP